MIRTTTLLILLTLTLLFPQGGAGEASAQELYVGSYNIRNKNNSDSINGNVWAKRCQVLCDLLNFEQPDIFGTQECFIWQIRDMEARLDGYRHIGVARDDGKEQGEHSAIFYKSDKLRLLRSGDFWLSETPDKPGLGWDAACVRICSWGQFKDVKTRLKFYFFSLHMDHVGKVARREAAKLVVSKIREIAGEKAPVILTGDFNVDQTDEIYQIFTRSGILNDSFECARLRFAENGTFNDFNGDLKTDSRIDHIFVSPRFTVDRFGVLTDAYWTERSTPATEQKSGQAPQEISFKQYDRRVPSDHYPIFARIKW